MNVGDPFHSCTAVGALISLEHRDRVLQFVREAIVSGAVKAIGGAIELEGCLQGGNYMVPCLLSNCQDDMRAVREEIFGPVVTLLKFDTESEAIERANERYFGLSSIFQLIIVDITM